MKKIILSCVILFIIIFNIAYASKCPSCNGSGKVEVQCIACEGKGFTVGDRHLAYKNGKTKPIAVLAVENGEIVKKTKVFYADRDDVDKHNCPYACKKCFKGMVKPGKWGLGKIKIKCDKCIGKGTIKDDEITKVQDVKKVSFGISLDDIIKIDIGKELHRIQMQNNIIILFKMNKSFVNLPIGEFHFGRDGLWKMRFISDKFMDRETKQTNRVLLLKKLSEMGFDDNTNKLVLEKTWEWKNGETMQANSPMNNYYHSDEFYAGIGMHTKWLFCDIYKKNLKPTNIVAGEEYDMNKVMPTILQKIK